MGAVRRQCRDETDDGEFGKELAEDEKYSESEDRLDYMLASLQN